MRSGLFKVEGAGNDFVLGLGHWAQRLRDEPELAPILCNRHRGIGADGVLSIEVVKDDQLRLWYRNADGSPASFCANATRCAARAAVELLGLAPSVLVMTEWASVPALVDDAEVTLELPPPPLAPRRLPLTCCDRQWSARYLVVGVPHLVITVGGDCSHLDLARLGPALAYHEAVAPEGANVNFVSTATRPQIRSWERGVDRETLACGSGVVAAALVIMSDEHCSEVSLSTAGADVLRVSALGTPPLCATRAVGPAHILAELHPSQALVQSS